jgi:branched-chain amino acid transport system ATP-binding protein
MSDIVLDIARVSKSFGALRAADEVSLTVERGEVHALIGPNGAGKTTLMAMITGELAPDGGRIAFEGRDITHLATAQRARLGLARSFQITSIFSSFTAEGNVALAVQATEKHSFRFWREARRIERLRRPARQRLAELGLAERADTIAAGMAHGEHRQLELAMALATEPRMLLLDEPMAGLGSEESEAMLALLAHLKGRYSILLVEHDMDVVFSLADRISVLVQGRVIASGSGEAIRNDAQVRTAYLGEDDEFGEAIDAPR